MKLLVLQHAQVEHPGIFCSYLREDGHEWVVVELDEGEPLQSLDEFDALWVMGGPMDVWEEDQYPWIRDEKEFIREAVERRGMPYLGFCLGHQLLAEALGGVCGKSKQPEIGIMPVRLTEAGATGVIFDDLPDVFDCLQWHSAEIQIMPAGATCLATSSDCAIQAMQWGPRAFSMQFHIEVEPETVSDWIEIPAYEASLKTAMGDGGVGILKALCEKKTTDFQKLSERIYINWLQTAAQV